MEEINILVEKLENNKIEMIRNLNDGFDEQEKYNADFFNNVLDLIKSEIRSENKENIENLNKIVKDLEHYLKLNQKLTDELIYRLQMTSIEETKILYKDIKQGIKQFSIQLGIVVSILLIILGSFQLIKLIF